VATKQTRAEFACACGKVFEKHQGLCGHKRMCKHGCKDLLGERGTNACFTGASGKKPTPSRPSVRPRTLLPVPAVRTTKLASHRLAQGDADTDNEANEEDPDEDGEEVVESGTDWNAKRQRLTHTGVTGEQPEMAVDEAIGEVGSTTCACAVFAQLTAGGSCRTCGMGDPTIGVRCSFVHKCRSMNYLLRNNGRLKPHQTPSCVSNVNHSLN
jgi:hypothetical protein